MESDAHDIKNLQLVYKEGTAFFSWNKGRIHFDEITTFYLSSSHQVTRGGYEINHYALTLILTGASPELTLKATSNTPASCCTLHRLFEALSVHIGVKMRMQFAEKKSLRFPTRKSFFLILKEDRVLVRNPQQGQAPLVIREILQDERGDILMLEGEKTSLKIHIEDISAPLTFLDMARDILATTRPKEVTNFQGPRRWGFCLITLLGIIGWFFLVNQDTLLQGGGLIQKMMLTGWVTLASVCYLICLCNPRIIAPQRKTQNTRDLSSCPLSFATSCLCPWELNGSWLA
ncbi:hypothetical protein [Desulfoluna sp.]|uniref:hypothetical protein n=1 Tax=Desulfoluna sp. TaxID=2045199 RepID=UPI0026336B28|nr:hypothetical protein [Desulfoluna sp.]